MTVEELTAQAAARLKNEGVPEASATAEFMMAATLGIARGQLRVYAQTPLEGKRRDNFHQFISRKLEREPLGYILGRQEFMGLDFEVTPAVLIPRPETELLVEFVLDALLNGQGAAQAKRKSLRILDVGTGSGCIAVSLACRLPDSHITAVDQSGAALKVAVRNASRHRVHTRVSFARRDLFRMRFPDNAFDAIVSNPPYIPSGRLGRLDPEVLREPHAALDGGVDGLRAIRAIVGGSARFLKKGGILALEIDERQGTPVRILMKNAGFASIEIRKDLAGLERVACGRRPS